MVAYNCKERFAEPIRQGLKPFTIRAKGKRRHANVGEAIQLYCGLRTKRARKIIPDPICKCRRDIKLDYYRGKIRTVVVDGIPFRDEEWLEKFAQADGFSGVDELSEFHARGKNFSGRLSDLVLIQWGESMFPITKGRETMAKRGRPRKVLDEGEQALATMEDEFVTPTSDKQCNEFANEFKKRSVAKGRANTAYNTAHDNLLRYMQENDIEAVTININGIDKIFGPAADWKVRERKKPKKPKKPKETNGEA